MRRFGDPTWATLDDLSTYFDTSAAAIIRQRIAPAKPEDFG
jgi:hypothetical protein